MESKVVRYERPIESYYEDESYHSNEGSYSINSLVEDESYTGEKNGVESRSAQQQSGGGVEGGATADPTAARASIAVSFRMIHYFHFTLMHSNFFFSLYLHNRLLLGPQLKW